MTVQTIDMLLVFVLAFTLGFLLASFLGYLDMRRRTEAFQFAGKLIMDEGKAVYEAYRSCIADLYGVIETPGGVEILRATMPQDQFDALIKSHEEERGVDTHA